MFRYPPLVALPPAVPTYTFPFATLGTVNFTAMPAGTSAEDIRVHDVAFESVVNRQSNVAPSKAHRFALPPLEALPASINQTIAFVEAFGSSSRGSRVQVLACMLPHNRRRATSTQCENFFILTGTCAQHKVTRWCDSRVSSLPDTAALQDPRFFGY